jgi:hypothetical protein
MRTFGGDSLVGTGTDGTDLVPLGTGPLRATEWGLSPMAAILRDRDQASSFCTTFPLTSVSRKSRP